MFLFSVHVKLVMVVNQSRTPHVMDVKQSQTPHVMAVNLRKTPLPQFDS
jgi:hypothetical protein